MSNENIKTKEELIELISFCYDGFVLRTRKRHINEAEKQLISKMKFNDLINLCKSEKIPILKKQLKENKNIWENIWNSIT